MRRAILHEELFRMMLMLIMKLLKRTLLKKVLAILLYILRRKILKKKFVENGLEREIKNGLDKHDSERKSPDSDKKKHLKKETHNMLLLRKSFQLAEISFMENMFIYILNLHLRQRIVKKKRFGWKRTFPENNVS